MGKNILILGHAYIIPANRGVWSELGSRDNVSVDLIVPEKWQSNLVGEVTFSPVEADTHINQIYPINTFFKGNGSLFFFSPIKLYKILKKSKYDLIVINQESWSLCLFFFNIVALFTKNRFGKIYLMIAQNIKKPKLRWLIPLETFNMFFVKLALGCCKETEEVLRWKNISTPWKYFPLYFNSSLPIKSFVKMPEEAKYRIGYLGRLSAEKGIDTLLEAFKLLNDNTIELTIAGDGPLNDTVKNSSVNYMGLLKHDQVEKFYNQIDCLIVPSKTMPFWKEQFGRVIVEAIAAGKSVIGSDSGAIPEVLEHLGLSTVFPEGNASELAKLIKEVKTKSSNLDFADTMKRAQGKCLALFSQDAFIQRLLKYDE